MFRFYKEAYASITDFSFYRTVFEQPPRKTILYVLLLAVHTAVVLTAVTAVHSTRMLTWAAENFPALEVQESGLEVDAEQPFILKYPGPNVVTFVFDTTGAHADSRQLSEPAVLFTKTQLHVLYLGRVQTYNWVDLPFRRLEDLVQVAKWVFLPTAFFVIFTYALAEKAVLVLLLSSIALVATTGYGIRLPFVQYLAIASYSLTPAVTIELAVSLTGMGSWVLSMICVLTAAIYAYMAAQRCVVIES